MRLSLKLEYLWLAPFLLGCTRTPRRYWKPFVRATSRSAVCCWTVALTRRNAERRGWMPWSWRGDVVGGAMADGRWAWGKIERWLKDLGKWPAELRWHSGFWVFLGVFLFWREDTILFIILQLLNFSCGSWPVEMVTSQAHFNKNWRYTHRQWGFNQQNIAQTEERWSWTANTGFHWHNSGEFYRKGGTMQSS